VKGDFSAFTGTVPNQISVEKAKEAAQICFLNNIAAALTQLKAGETLRLVQIQGFVQSANDFHDQPIVLNGASELAVQILGENGKHARTAVGVSTLPKNVAVEISCTFQAIKE
jgi:enamine deaminase RidA (YjgF/YER057c/UK114 family)